MKQQLLKAVLFVATLQITLADAGEEPHKPDSGSHRIAQSGSQASVTGSEQYFTGRSRIDPLWPANEDINVSGGLVTSNAVRALLGAPTRLASG